MFAKPSSKPNRHSPLVSLGVPSLCDGAGRKAMLAVSNLKFAYAGQPVVDGLSFAVPAGSITCMLGASGSGKSTTLRLIAGLQDLQAGQVIEDAAGRC